MATLSELQNKSHQLWRDIINNIVINNIDTFQQIEELAKCKLTHDKICDNERHKNLSITFHEIIRLKKIYKESCFQNQEVKDKIHQLKNDRVEIINYYANQKALCYGLNTINICYIDEKKSCQSVLSYAVYYGASETVHYLLTNKEKLNVSIYDLLLLIQIAI